MCNLINYNGLGRVTQYKVISYTEEHDKFYCIVDHLIYTQFTYHVDKFKDLADMEKEINKKIKEIEKREKIKKDKKDKVKQELDKI